MRCWTRYWYDGETGESFVEPVAGSQEAELGDDQAVDRAALVHAVTKVQAIFRGKINRRDMLAMRQAACRIQAAHRGRHARQQMGMKGMMLSRQAVRKFKRTHFSHSMPTNFSRPPPRSHFSYSDTVAGDFGSHEVNVMHGQLDFDAGRKALNSGESSLAAARQAKFIRLETMTEPFRQLRPSKQLERAQTLSGLVDFMTSAWGVPLPSVIFSVTGGGASILILSLRVRDSQSRPGTRSHSTDG
jgi:hypothetical protein